MAANRRESAKQEKELYHRVKELPFYSGSEKEKKTFVLPREIIEEFDRFADRERLNKSDLLHVALRDFLDTYTK